jgi:parallel beta-helix repeat protein
MMDWLKLFIKKKNFKYLIVLSILSLCFVMFQNFTASLIKLDSMKALVDVKKEMQIQGTQVYIAGFYNPGDGGQGTFVWNPNLSIHNGGTMISPTVKYVPGAAGWWNPSTTQGAWQRIYDNKVINLNWFGVMGDQVNIDYTTAFLNITKWVGLNLQGIYLPKGVFRTRFIRLYNGTVSFVGDGIIKGIGTTDVNGLLQLDGPGFGGVAVSNISVKTNIDMSNGDVKGIHANQCINCKFIGNNIFGFTTSDTDAENVSAQYKYGILLNNGSSGNIVSKNKITGSFNPKARQMLIDILGTYSKGIDFGGYFTGKGTFTKPLVPAEKNIVDDNELTNGSYGVLILGGVRNRITNNKISRQNHRGIAMYMSWYTYVFSNIVTDYRSTGILIAYMSNYTVVRNNIFKDVSNPFGASDEASININLGSSFSYIDSNEIDSERTYGVYMGVGMFKNTIINNSIKGFNRVGIALENDWEDNPQPLAKYSRSNYSRASEISSSDTWVFQDSQLNVIEGNTIDTAKPFFGNGYKHATCGIYVSAINPSVSLKTRNWRNIIKNNVILDPNLTHYLYIYEEIPGTSFGHNITNNSVPTSEDKKIYIGGKVAKTE